MFRLIDGQKYLLPNGEIVTAKRIEQSFLLEFRRKYRAPLAVGKSGQLILRGEETGWTVDALSAYDDSDEKQESH